MKKIAVLIEDQFDEKELIYPYIRLKEEGYEVDLLGTEANKSYSGKSGYQEVSTHSTKNANPDNYDAVIIPGGFSPDYMRRNKETVNFVKTMNDEGKIVAAICHGPWLLASACDLRSKNVTSFFSIKDDVIHAGANYIDESVVVDGNLITSRTPKDLPDFLKAIIENLK